MHASNSPKKGSPSTQLTQELRHFLCRQLICRAVEGLKMHKIFFESQDWEGFDIACDSWQVAYWRWVEHQIPSETAMLLGKKQGNWSKRSASEVLNQLK